MLKADPYMLSGNDEMRSGVQLVSPIPSEHFCHISGGGNGTLLWFCMPMVSPSADEQEAIKRTSGGIPAQISLRSSHTFTVGLRGKLRLLVVEDQRTMRQMVAMLFQRLAVQAAGALTVELCTAISGEEALRKCAKRRFHIVTMDQQLSTQYCEQMQAEQRTKNIGGASGKPSCDYILFDGDKLQNAKKRNAFFEAETAFHDIIEGDGKMLGHEAMARIRAEVPEKDQPIIFNLTGNVLESDQQMYEGNGSNGVLPKPAKLETLIHCFESSIDSLLSSKMCDLDPTLQQVQMDDGEVVIATATSLGTNADSMDLVEGEPGNSEPPAPKRARVRDEA